MHQLAVVGCGYWGPNLIRNFGTLPDCTVMLVCDRDQERLQYIEQLYPSVRTTTCFADVLDDNKIDAVAIVTPIRTHHALADEALRAGKHVFIEKPMATSRAECERLIELAKLKELTLMVGHTFVYSPSVRYIKEMVDGGALGDLLYISSRRLNLGLLQTDINVLWDLAPHDVSIILYLLGEQPTAVTCSGKAHITDAVEDVTALTLNFANGRFATVHSSWIDPLKVRETTIVGSRQMIVYDDTAPQDKIRVYDKCVEVPPHYDTYAEFQFSYHYGGMHCPYVKQVEPLSVECRHFLDCIDHGAQPDSSGWDGLRVVSILEAASLSLQEGGAPVQLTADPVAYPPTVPARSLNGQSRQPLAQGAR